MTWPPSSHRQYKPPNQICDLQMTTWLTSASSLLLLTFTTKFSILPAAPFIPSHSIHSSCLIPDCMVTSLIICVSVIMELRAPAWELQIHISNYLSHISQKIQISHIIHLTQHLLTTHLIFRVDDITTIKLPEKNLGCPWIICLPRYVCYTIKTTFPCTS